MADAVCPFCGGTYSEPDHVYRCDGRQGAREFDAAGGFAYVAHEHARPSNPETSKAAAATVENPIVMQARVEVLLDPPGLTDEKLGVVYEQHFGFRLGESKASPRKRRSDLVRLGRAIDSGIREVLSTGRKAVVWRRTTPEERRAWALAHEDGDR